MEDPTQLIPEITAQMRNWVVRVTVTEDIPVMICTTNSRLNRYVLTNNEGNEIIAAIYGRDVPLLTPMVHLYCVYDISNAEVRTTPPQYHVLKNMLQ
ncbi:hypothetical protein LIER_39010 [Lithospermum erythrorhizon]|uniref:Uncharacterized protein n=1 Tax=Lithospermum erythrorhizon TaxID=34254 RepID=A0AAV3QBH1_LITER